MPETTVQRAFVVSPIGAPGSRQRHHADWVRRQLIDAACERLRSSGIEVRTQRSDDITQFGHITDQVVDRIVEDDIIFVVLGESRPNCYFELGVAISAGRPVIILKDRNEPTQFDTTDYRVCVEYDVPESVDQPAREADIEVLRRRIAEVLEQPRFTGLVHGRHDPLGHNSMNYEVVDKFQQISVDQYSKFFQAATGFIALQGITLDHFTNIGFHQYRTPNEEGLNFFQFIKSKVLFDACDVHILMMDAHNAALPHLHRRPPKETAESILNFQADLKNTRDKIKKSYRDWMRFKEHEIDPAPIQREDGRKGSLRIMRVRHGVVHYRLSMTNKELILSPYINVLGTFNSHGPAFRANAETMFYDRIKREYFDLIAQNTNLDDDSALENTGIDDL